jgi:Pyruvate/2-oxoacid:ferredoxin oxidoreductase delta subunit
MTHGLTIQERDANDNLTGDWRYATPDEIKAAHPKCGTCLYSPISDAWPSDLLHCEVHSFKVNPKTDYCGCHEPKEQL